MKQSTLNTSNAFGASTRLLNKSFSSKHGGVGSTFAQPLNVPSHIGRSNKPALSNSFCISTVESHQAQTQRAYRAAQQELFRGGSTSLLFPNSGGTNEIPYKIDYKCEWDLPMYCDLTAETGRKTTWCPGDDKKHVESENNHGEYEDEYRDQNALDLLPDVGFFQKIK